jgi:hypothetical protein
MEKKRQLEANIKKAKDQDEMIKTTKTEKSAPAFKGTKITSCDQIVVKNG